MIKESQINAFVAVLKAKGVEYDTKTKTHWKALENLGGKIKVISNEGMKNMCDKIFGSDYTLEISSTKRKIRETIFRKLRQDQINKEIKQRRGEQNG